MDEDRKAFNAILQAGIEAEITALESDEFCTFLSKKSEDFQAGFNFAVKALRGMADSLDTEDDNDST